MAVRIAIAPPQPMDPADTVRFLARFLPLLAAAALLQGCASTGQVAGASRNQIIISIEDQKLTVVTQDHRRMTFPISTSKFGLGDRRGSLATPTGELEVAQKFGDGAAAGTVFHGRVRTGEIVKVDAPGRDAIVTRILALRGLEASNKGAFSRGIYIHGTPEERNIGRPVSYGCIRMRSSDVIQLYNMVGVGARVEIIDTTMNRAIASNVVESPAPPPTASIPGGSIGAAMTPASATEVKIPGSSSSQAFAAAAAATANATATMAAKPAKKEWAGAPSRLLAKQAALEAKSRNNHPVGAPRPGSNNSEGESSRDMNRSALDSL